MSTFDDHNPLEVKQNLKVTLTFILQDWLAKFIIYQVLLCQDRFTLRP